MYAGSAYTATFCIGQVALQLFASRWADDTPPGQAFKLNVPGQWDQWSRQVYPTGNDFAWPIEFTLDDSAVDKFTYRWLDLRP